jgi:hypothetical protein
MLTPLILQISMLLNETPSGLISSSACREGHVWLNTSREALATLPDGRTPTKRILSSGSRFPSRR